MCESAEVSSETFPKARRDRRCYECGGVIPKGTKHHRFSGCWDGGWQNYRTCMSCYNIRDFYAEKYPHEMGKGYMVFGELFSNLHEGLDKDPNLLLTLLYTGGTDHTSNMSAVVNDDILKAIYAGKAGYEVWKTVWPHNHIGRVTQKSGVIEHTPEQAVAFMLESPGDRSLVCVADCGVFDVTAVISSREILADFLNPLDTRPKRFFSINSNYLAYLMRSSWE